MRVWLKRISVICLIPAVLMLLVSVLLYIPAIQNFIAGRAASYISKSTKTEVGFENFRISFPLNISVNQAHVVGQDSDTLLYLDKMTAHVRLMPLFKGEISINSFVLESLRLNTKDFIAGINIKGAVGKAYLYSELIDLNEEKAFLSKTILSDTDIDLLICDTTDTETPKSNSKWMIESKKIEVKNTSLSCQMPGDSIFVDTQINEAVLSDGFADVDKMQYKASSLYLDMQKINYDKDFEEPLSGFDPSHIHLSNISLSLDSLCYDNLQNLHVKMKACSFSERSGFFLKSMAGSILFDSTQIKIPALTLQTAYSKASIQANMPWLVTNKKSPTAPIAVNITSYLDKRDVLLTADNKINKLRAHYPDTALNVEILINGNTKNLAVRKFDISAPGIFSLKLNGKLNEPANNKLRSGKVNVEAKTKNLSFLTQAYPSLLQSRFRIPDSLNISGVFTIEKGLYSSEMLLTESLGKIHLSGHYDIGKKEYEAFLGIDSLEPVHFMPKDSILWLNAFIKAKGKGFRILEHSTRAEIESVITDVHYKKTFISGISMNANIENGNLKADLTSAYPLLKGSVIVNGSLSKEKIQGSIVADIDTLDFHKLNVTKTPLTSSFQVFSEIESDLDKAHLLDVTLGNWNLFLEKQTIKPKMLTLSFRSEQDTVRSAFNAGDLKVMLTGNADLKTLTERLTVLSKDIETQLKTDSTVNFQQLRSSFPEMSLKIHAERDNPIQNFFREYNFFFENLSLDAAISPEEGLNVNGQVLSFFKDTFRIDTAHINIIQDTLGLQYAAKIIKKSFRNQNAFSASAKGYIHAKEVDLLVSFVNDKGETGVNLGLNAGKVDEGFNLRLYPENPVIAFLPFSMNKDNYLKFKSIKDIDADVYLEGKSNASLWIHSNKNDSNSMEAVMFEFNKIDLKKVSDGFSGMPSLKGTLDLALRYEPVENSFMIVADGYIDSLFYEKEPVGELLLNTVYTPMGKGIHQADMHVFHDQSEVLSSSILYKNKSRTGHIEGFMKIEQFPLRILSPLVPRQMARLDGFMHSDLSLKGTTVKPVINGVLQMNNASVFLIPSSTMLRFDEKQVKISNGVANIDKYKIFALKNNPFILNGIIDLKDLNVPTANINLTAQNTQLVDSKKKPESLFYGKLFMDINSTLKGPLQSLRMRGNVHILGNTDIAYVMQESPLEVQDKFHDLVTFTYFADTLPRRKRRLSRMTRDIAAISGADILMNINVDPVVKMRIDMGEEQSNFIELKGGGDLSFQYNLLGEINMNGRYTISGGAFHYKMPVVSITGFKIKNGSYVDWSGPLMNPFLNITAYNRIRTSVKVEEHSRMVDFDAGVQMKDNLEDLSLQFLLEAPNDVNVQNQLIAMGEEERSKQAISLLVAGVYLGDQRGGFNDLDVSGAISGLLEKEIKNMLGSLVGEIPFSFDVNSYDGTNGMGRRIDYTGSFYKSFLNDRLNTSLALRYSTKDPVSGNQLLLDDLSFEYRLDPNGERSVKAFQSKDYENIFEGEITKTGAGFSLQRKVKRIRDFFIWKKHKTKQTETKENAD